MEWQDCKPHSVTISHKWSNHKPMSLPPQESPLTKSKNSLSETPTIKTHIANYHKTQLTNLLYRTNQTIR